MITFRGVCLFAALTSVLQADNVLHPGTPILDRPTLISIGIQLPLTGDDNYNSIVTVQYRKVGDVPWKQAQPLFRVHPDTTLPYVIAPQFAGSILDLRPATTYEIQLHVTDSDGPVDQIFSLAATTRPVPGDPLNPRIVNVTPATGNGPLNAALANAQAGDIITLAPGLYSGQFLIGSLGTPTRPVVIRGTSRDGVILDGGNCLGCNVLELYGSWIHVENLTVRNAERAIRFQTVGAQGNVVRRVRITNVISGIGSKSSQVDFYIADNVLEGRILWPNIYSDFTNPDVPDGIHMEGNGHVIAHNTISGFGDGMKVAQDGARANDFYGNDILWGYDNGVELDASEGNVRLMRNRFTNTYNPISAQPIYGGPAYIYRNVAMNTVVEELKLHSEANPTREPNGVFIYHNTFVSAYGALILETPTSVHHFAIENNLFIGPQSPVDNTPVDFFAFVDDGLFDYNGYWPDGFFAYNFKSGRINAPSFAALQKSGAGLEPHGLLVNPQTLASGIIGPSNYKIFYPPQDFALSSNSIARDRGVVLPNINDGYVGAAPDLGAIELGCPAPIYGPRPTGIDEVNEPYGCTISAPPPPLPPTTDSVTPNSGSGATQSFTFKFSSSSGYKYLNTVYGRINSTVSANAGCSVYFQQAGNGLFLLNDAGTAATAAQVAPGAAATLQNSQCSIDVAKSSAAGSANTLTMIVAVTFKAAFAGAKTVFGSASDNGNLSSGWQTLGTWKATAAVAPTADSVSPNSGAGASQSFTLKYSSVNGYASLNTVSALFNTTLTGGGACYVYYQVAANALYLFNDAGTGPTGSQVAPSTAATLQNSQCSIDVAKSSVAGSGNTLTLVLAVTFKAPFAGAKTISGSASDTAALTSGWRTLGTWNSTPQVIPAPTADSVAPNTGTGLSQSFTVKASSPNGYTYLNTVNVLFNSTLSASGGCYVYYQLAANALYLFNDARTGPTGSQVPPGTAATLQNSQCSIDLAKSSAQGSGNTLALIVAVTFKAAFAGAQTVFGSASDNGGHTSGWRTLGTWNSTAPVNPAPTADSVTPNPGTGGNQTFTARYSSPSGYAYLNTVYALFNTTFSGSAGCYVYYQVASHGLYLFNDSGNAPTGPGVVPGNASTLQNSQCSIDVANSSAIGSGNTLALSIAVAFKPGFGGAKTIFGLATDNAGLKSGWQTLGTIPAAPAWWKPAVRASWQVQYQGSLDLTLNVDVFDLDGFAVSAGDVAAIHAKGHRAVCYFSAGALENWRSDASNFPSTVLGNAVSGVNGERWLDIRRLDILGPLMATRMDLCKAKGFDAVDPDNVNGYMNLTKFPLSYGDQLAYNRFLAKAAHDRGLAVGLKNDVNQVNDLLPSFDFQVNERCFELKECNLVTPFIQAGKPVFNIEYKLQTAQFCPQALSLQFSSIRKNTSLDAFVQACK